MNHLILLLDKIINFMMTGMDNNIVFHFEGLILGESLKMDTAVTVEVFRFFYLI